MREALGGGEPKSPTRADGLRKRIEEIETLASPPVSLDRILALAGDPDARVSALGKAIQCDPAISVRVLRLANSAYFGFSRRVESVDEAIMVVGFRNVRNLAACAAVAPVFGSGEGTLDRPALWRHSCGVAEAARLVASHQGGDEASAYITGLLHDLGQVVLNEALGEDYERGVEKRPGAGLRLCEAERAAFGADHAWAGAALCENWHLSPELVGAVRGHHEPGAKERDPGGSAVRVALAEQLAEGAGLGDPLDPLPSGGPSRELMRALRLGESECEVLADALAARREAIDALYRGSLG